MLFAIQTVNCNAKQGDNYSVKILGITDLDNDSLKDTVLAYKYSNSIILPKFILWGTSPADTVQKTELVYPSSSKVIRSYCLITNINKDALADLFLSTGSLSDKDSVKDRIVSNTYILYADSNLKKIRKIYLDDIKGFQKYPYMAHSFQKSKYLSRYGYDKFNDKPITLIEKIDTDALEEEQKKSAEQPSGTLLSAKIYPNPVSEILTISFNHCKGAGIQAYISNISGFDVLNRTILCPSDSYEEHIDVSALPAGVYHLLLKFNCDKSEHYSFVVMH